MSKPITLVGGTTPAARRMVVEAAGAAAAPTLPTDGAAMYGADWLHVYVAFTTATACGIVPWFWSAAAELWFAGDALSLTAAGDNWAIVEVRGEDRVYLQVTSVTGGGTVDAWGAYSYDGYGGL